MLRYSIKNLNLLVSVMFLFLLIYQNQIYATKVDVATTYGFNSTDATAALQTAIDKKAADTLIVRNMGTDWIVRPIFLRSANQTIIFEKGVNVVAKPGEFHGAGDCLFSTRAADRVPSNANNITLIGYGATFRMQKADYMNPALYTAYEWRCCIYILEVSGIKVLGLTLKDSGGDGILVYWGASNVLIKDVILDNHYRQAISPCDFRNLTIENCVMINTIGNAGGPCAGIDFEPDADYMFVQNGKVSNCYLANNNGGGILFAFWLTNPQYAPVSIEVKHCFISSKNWSAIDLARVPDNGIKGTVSFENCITECSSPSSQVAGGIGIGKSANTYLAKFTSCLWQNCNTAIKFYKGNESEILGNLQFVNSTINEPEQQLTIQRDFDRGVFAVANITGNIKINGPYGLSSSSLGGGTNVTVQLTEQKSKPPIVTSVTPNKGNPDKVTFFTAGDAINISAVAWDPDNGTTSGAGIKQVDFALWRSNNAVGSAVASYSDVSAPYAWPITTSTKCPRGIYLIRITTYSNDGSYTVAVVPIYIFNTIDGPGPYINGSGIEFGNETFNIMPEKDFLIRNTSQGFMVYSPFSTDSRIVISDLSGRQVTLAQNVKGNSWNNIIAQNKFSNSVYFIQTTDKKGNNRIVKKAMIGK